jgi:hypothetical protein
LNQNQKLWFLVLTRFLQANRIDTRFARKRYGPPSRRAFDINSASPALAEFVFATFSHRKRTGYFGAIPAALPWFPTRPLVSHQSGASRTGFVQHCVTN